MSLTHDIVDFSGATPQVLWRMVLAKNDNGQLIGGFSAPNASEVYLQKTPNEKFKKYSAAQESPGRITIAQEPPVAKAVADAGGSATEPTPTATPAPAVSAEPELLDVPSGLNALGQMSRTQIMEKIQAASVVEPPNTMQDAGGNLYSHLGDFVGGKTKTCNMIINGKKLEVDVKYSLTAERTLDMTITGIRSMDSTDVTLPIKGAVIDLLARGSAAEFLPDHWSLDIHFEGDTARTKTYARGNWRFTAQVKTNDGKVIRGAYREGVDPYGNVKAPEAGSIKTANGRITSEGFDELKQWSANTGIEISSIEGSRKVYQFQSFGVLVLTREVVLWTFMGMKTKPTFLSNKPRQATVRTADGPKPLNYKAFYELKGAVGGESGTVRLYVDSRRQQVGMSFGKSGGTQKFLSNRVNKLEYSLFSTATLDYQILTVTTQHGKIIGYLTQWD